MALRWATMRAAGLILALVLTGCTADETGAAYPVPRSGPTPPTAIASIMSSTLASFAFSLDPTSASANASFAAPEGVVKAVLNVTLLGGAAVGFEARTSTCLLALGGPAPADGNTYGQDCGAIRAGNDTLVVSQGSGAISGTVTLEALVCMQQPHTVCYT